VSHAKRQLQLRMHRDPSVGSAQDRDAIRAQADALRIPIPMGSRSRII
jgi:hypothetical protein